jgi:Asp-tRNA(Asn)/Glu-tRNA(Gln) amidotransferase A subunit family amidase
LPLSGPLPVGLMLLARNGDDRNLLRIAATVMELLQA